ncbi:MAG TPA: sulfite exporter TauE/SafE family protein, partial [Mycobacteriales bacterium]|nr:sulfite exporter TauE/SafE family protein [Mycobacteriales bacterium]
SGWPGYLGSVLGFREELAGQRRRITALTAVAIAGAVVGCVALLAAPAGAFDIIVPFLVLLACLLLALQPRIKALVGPPDPERGDNVRVLYPVVFAAAAYGGYFGGALGVILLGTLALSVHDSLRRINAAKSALSLIVSTVTVLAFSLFGPVRWSAVAVIAPASLLGGFLGARIARRLNDRILRAFVVIFGVGVAIYLFIRG